MARSVSFTKLEVRNIFDALDKYENWISGDEDDEGRERDQAAIESIENKLRKAGHRRT